MWFSVPRKCQYSVQESIKRLQMKIHKTGRFHSKRPRGIVWCNWGEGRGILRTLSSITFLKNKTEICVLRLRLITIFSTCEKTNCQKVDQPGQACVSHVPRSPQVMILQSFYCKNNYSLLSWDRKWSRPLFWLPPTDSSPFSIPRFSFTSSAIRIALHLALQTSEQPLKVEPQPSRLRKQRGRERKEKRYVQEEMVNSSEDFYGSFD